MEDGRRDTHSVERSYSRSQFGSLLMLDPTFGLTLHYFLELDLGGFIDEGPNTGSP